MGLVLEHPTVSGSAGGSTGRDLAHATDESLLSTGFGRALASAPLRGSFDRLAPALALLSFAFGAWYALGALDVAPYFF